MGNLAYARLRSPAVAAQYARAVAAAVHRAQTSTRLFVQPLSIDIPILRQRRTEPGPDEVVDEFFWRVAQEVVAIADEPAIPVCPALDTGQNDIPTCLNILLDRIQEPAPDQR